MKFLHFMHFNFVFFQFSSGYNSYFIQKYPSLQNTFFNPICQIYSFQKNLNVRNCITKSQVLGFFQYPIRRIFYHPTGHDLEYLAQIESSRQLPWKENVSLDRFSPQRFRLGFQIQGKLFNRLTDNMFRLKGIQNKKNFD